MWSLGLRVVLLSDENPLQDIEGLVHKQGYLGETAPRGVLPVPGKRILVDHPAQLQQVVGALKQAKTIAIDAEFMQTRSRARAAGTSNVPRLALLQLAIEQSCFVIDVLRLHDLSPLEEVISNPDVTVLLHGAGGDIRVMAERGLFVAHYFDLEATCRSIFGQHESSLAAMMQRAFGAHLDKSFQRADWMHRPLMPAMIVYAARDAEVTLALYSWLETYYPHILGLHESINRPENVAEWIEPFLQGNAPLAAEMAVADAKTKGIIRNKAQVVTDCRAALERVRRPMFRSRLIRLIADLSLTQLTPDLLVALHGKTSDERSAAIRALSRMGVMEAAEEITLLLDDPVQDVREAAWNALRSMLTKESQHSRTTPVRAEDGTRSWVVEDKSVGENEEKNDWKTMLRSIIDA
jgi:hypothetical protein